MGSPTVDEIVVADPPESWRRLGFEVDGDGCLVGTIRLRLAGDAGGRGVVGWSLRDVVSSELDGLSTTLSTNPPRDPGGEHPNAVVSVDHVVAFSPSLERTVPVLEAAGLPLRRIREAPTPAGDPRQAFFRLGEAILEVIERPVEERADRPAKLMALAFRVSSMERCAERIGDDLAAPHDAVQPGRRIATVRRTAGLGLPVAFMTRPPERERAAPAPPPRTRG